jgi:hypothetical protein
MISPSLRVEPLSPAIDRSTFTSGSEPLDHYFQHGVLGPNRQESALRVVRASGAWQEGECHNVPYNQCLGVTSGGQYVERRSYRDTVWSET